MNTQRIFNNIDELLSFLIKHPESKDSLAIKIIIQNLEFLKEEWKTVVSYNSNPNDKINLETWFDNCFWINYLGAFIELVALLQHDEQSESDKLIRPEAIKLIQDTSCISIAKAFILCRFIRYSSYTKNRFEWLHDEFLRNALMILTKQIFLRIFSLAESSIVELYNKMLQQNEIEKIEPQINILRKLFEELKKKGPLDDAITKKIDKEIKRIENSEIPPFQRVIRSITEKLLNEHERDAQINQWLFMADLRNSLMHRVDTATTDRATTLWGREFRLKKGELFTSTEYNDQYIIFSIRIIQMFLELTCRINQSDKWENIKKAFLEIQPDNAVKQNAEKCADNCL